MTQRCSSSDLHEAILANSQTVVEHYLNTGNADPNRSPKLAPLSVISTAVQERARDLHRKLGRVFRSRPNGCIYPLHVAVCNAYHHATEGREDALGIIKALLQAGADPQKGCNGISFCKIGSHPSVAIASLKTPAKLALFLKRFPSQNGSCSMMDQVAKLLLEADAESFAKPSQGEGTKVRDETVALWHRLWENPTHHDITFICPDGQVHAHRCVLAGAIPYFATAFDGHWKESNSKEWKTENSCKVVKGVMRFVYTGTVDEETLEADTAGLLAVAAEYQLEALKQACEKELVAKISVETVKKSLVLANLHSLLQLKQKCFDFVQENSVEALTNASLMSLSTENKELWKEMVDVVRVRQQRKRKRDDSDPDAAPSRPAENGAIEQHPAQN